MSITWNGVSSDTIGVIVERIPNRYVPTRRFSPQQVAGRNGNILLVDKAFPNVEQEYEVYLSAEAQGLPSVARACAEWLMGPDGYCRLTDSYDTTVYREAFLMGGFDIENILNKFGRCTITFSCKPQKYLLTGDTPIEIPDGTTTTYTGDVVQFDVITGASITSLSATISPIQDLHGYSSPWPAGGGKQVLDPSIFVVRSSVLNGVTGSVNADGTITLHGTATANVIFDFVPYTALSDYGLEPDISYTLSGYISNSVYVMFGVYGSGTDYRASTVAGAVMTFTESQISSLRYRLVIYIANGTNVDDVVVKPMICKTASTDPAVFAPYANLCPISGRTGLSVYVGPTQDQQDATTYAVDWTSEAGTVYGGTLDVVTGVLTVDRAIVDLGTLNWQYESSGATRFFTDGLRSSIKFPTNYDTAANAISSMYANRTYNQFAATEKANGTMAVSSSGWLSVRNTAYADVASFTAAMNGQTFVYELATPLTYQLTAQEVEALVGTNNVWSSSGDVSVTVTTLLGGIVTNPTPFEARPLLTVSGVGEITINGKSIHILESVSDFEIDCETMEAEDNSKIYCMDFPELSGGENEIVGDGSITALTVTPRWWTL